MPITQSKQNALNYSSKDSDDHVKDDISDTMSDGDSSIEDKESRKRKLHLNIMEEDEEQRNKRRVSNRLSAQRSRERQRTLDASLKEKLTQIQREKNDLETRFKNSVNKILKRSSLPSMIPEEFSPLGSLLALIHEVSLSQTCVCNVFV